MNRDIEEVGCRNNDTDIELQSRSEMCIPNNHSMVPIAVQRTL